MSFNPTQVAKAIEAVEDDGAVAFTGKFGGSYEVVSSDGQTHYFVDTDYTFCTCEAGQRGRLCWHKAAAFAYAEGIDALTRTVTAAAA